MTPLTLKQKARRRGRIFDFDPLTPQEIQQWEKEKEKLDEQCYRHFEKIRSRLIETHYNWCVAVEPESGYYLLDKDWENLILRIKIYCPKSHLMIYGINETGTCGRI
ncbi:hypothetical protein VB834_24420 [Limnoraphis robusta Tam1]|uniref:hypothetical protein n=1 Tax=Limnoraphis robusta TaxID=1118279 RepID=UPI002B204929|nr:hypothetical protein [Limnoraphis robusta]MEA5495829.1 hypothetical protein [Limnoraphis robusta BA-68 BA1]MEA5542183.1 hypothetical protein [Limnoraphis robusta Tam1]